MHPIDLVCRVSFVREIWLDGVIQHSGKCDDVTERDMSRRSDSIGLVLPETGVSQRNLLLIIEPVLIIGAKARIKDPLLKAKIALRKVLRDRVSFRAARVPREIGNAGDDPAAPVF